LSGGEAANQGQKVKRSAERGLDGKRKNKTMEERNGRGGGWGGLRLYVVGGTPSKKRRHRREKKRNKG